MFTDNIIVTSSIIILCTSDFFVRANYDFDSFHKQITIIPLCPIFTSFSTYFEIFNCFSKINLNTLTFLVSNSKINLLDELK